MLLFTCSKEEIIPFEESVKDTLEPNYYHDLQGRYRGVIADVIYPNETTITVLDTHTFYVEVQNYNYENIYIPNISNRVESAARSGVYRLTDGAYLRFEESSLADSVGIDTVLADQFMNGSWYSSSKRLQYFIYYVDGNGDTLHQWFEGFKQ
jgi:hypothetical protein